MISYDDIKSGRAVAPVADQGLYLAAIQIDGGTQSRATLNQQTVDDYAEAIQAGATFPPIVVFYDGKKHWLADGFHRFHAYRKLGFDAVTADVRQGTRRDAILHSVGANETHGLRRTRDDKRRAILTLLNDSEWGAKPETWIAETCRVSRSLVRTVLTEQPHLVEKQDRSTVREVTRGGKTYAMQTAAIGGKPVTKENLATEPATPEPMEIKASEPETVEHPATPFRNIFDELVSLWKEASAGVRQDFKAYITGVDFVAKFNLTAGNPAPCTGAERASSAVEVGATNSPDGANETRGGLPVAAASGTAEETGRTLAYTRTGKSGTPSIASVTAGETASNPVANVGEEANGAMAAASIDPASRDVDGADRQQPVMSGFTGEADRDAGNMPICALTPRDDLRVDTNSQSAVPTAEEAAAETPMAPRPSAAANPFNNPRCREPEGCHLLHNRDACFDCTMAWAQRPKEEQVRLWAEANEAARAA